jgi:hypothetical protein
MRLNKAPSAAYTVLTGQNTADLAVTGMALNGATIADLAGNQADTAGIVINPAGTLQIDTTVPTIAIAPIAWTPPGNLTSGPRQNAPRPGVRRADGKSEAACGWSRGL